MSLSELLTVLPPPADVVASVGDWRVIEAQLAVPLPSDYKEFVSLYGVGSVRESIWILSPFSKYFSLQEKLQEHRRVHAELTENLGHDIIPYPVFPEPGGILPWATTSDGSVCSWVTTSSAPDSWVVFVESPEWDWEQFECSMTAFLAGALSGRINSFVIPPGFLSDPLIYIPYAGP